MEEERNDLPVLANDQLLQVAEQAEKRIDAVTRIKKLALKVTNHLDWTSQGGKPYLQVWGAEKVARLFGISWTIEEPQFEKDEDGHYTYTYKGIFTFGSATIEAIGTRSSRDVFFTTRYKDDVKTTLKPDEVDRSDVKKAALTNCIGNGISRVLGIRNMTWDELAESGIPKDKVGKVEYKTKEGQDYAPPPQAKQDPAKPLQQDGTSVITEILRVTQKTGEKNGKPWTRYTVFGHLNGNETGFTTFDKNIADEAFKEKDTGALFQIEYEKTNFGYNLKSFSRVEEGPAQ